MGGIIKAIKNYYGSTPTQQVLREYGVEGVAVGGGGMQGWCWGGGGYSMET